MTLDEKLPVCAMGNYGATLSVHYSDGTRLCLSRDWKKCPYSLLEGYLVLYDVQESPSDMIVLCRCRRASAYIINTKGAKETFKQKT